MTVDLAAVDSYEAAAELDHDQLRVLFETGRPEQRVWAIWALALEHGPAELIARVGRQPDAGVRRTLAVILASHGEYDLLLGLARDDPSIAVRASAVQLATRLAAGDAIDRAVVDDATRAEPEIRIALLGAIDTGAPAWLIAIARDALASPAPEVQEEAFETLVRTGDDDDVKTASWWMVEQREPWLLIDRWLRAAAAIARVDPDLGARRRLEIGEAFARTSRRTRGHVLAQLRAPPWPMVQRLIGGDVQLLRVAFRRPDIAIPTRTLVRAIQRGEHRGFLVRLLRQLAIAMRGRVLVDDLRRSIEALQVEHSDDVDAVAELVDRGRRLVRDLEVVDGESVLDDVESQHPVEQLLGLEHALVRWLDRDEHGALLAELPALRDYARARLDDPRGLDGSEVTAFEQLIEAIDLLTM